MAENGHSLRMAIRSRPTHTQNSLLNGDTYEYEDTLTLENRDLDYDNFNLELLVCAPSRDWLNLLSSFPQTPSALKIIHPEAQLAKPRRLMIIIFTVLEQISRVLTLDRTYLATLARVDRRPLSLGGPGAASHNQSLRAFVPQQFYVNLILSGQLTKYHVVWWPTKVVQQFRLAKCLPQS